METPQDEKRQPNGGGEAQERSHGKGTVPQYYVAPAPFHRRSLKKKTQGANHSGGQQEEEFEQEQRRSSKERGEQSRVLESDWKASFFQL
jgi:hypothetical protein